MAERTHTGTGAGANVAHEKPIVKKEVVKEHPEVVHKEHHVQPIIHEKERHVQPIHKTEVTKEHPVEHRERVVLGEGRAEHQKPSLGQQMRGSLKEAAGSLTGDRAKKEEGKTLKHGIEPSSRQ